MIPAPGDSASQQYVAEVLGGHQIRTTQSARSAPHNGGSAVGLVVARCASGAAQMNNERPANIEPYDDDDDDDSPPTAADMRRARQSLIRSWAPRAVEPEPGPGAGRRPPMFGIIN